MAGDLASILLRKSVGSLRDDALRCGGCRRTPLTGEVLYVGAKHVLCSLCAERLPESEREALDTRRVHASERPLAVVRHAA